MKTRSRQWGALALLFLYCFCLFGQEYPISYVNLGVYAGDGTGDGPRTSFTKLNNNVSNLMHIAETKARSNSLATVRTTIADRQVPALEVVAFDQFTSNQIPMLRFTSGLNTIRVIGSATNFVGHTNGTFETDFFNHTDADYASYGLITNAYPVDVVGLEYSLTPRPGGGGTTFPFSYILISTNYMDGAGQLQLNNGFHIGIGFGGVNVQLYTNGVSQFYDLGTIGFNVQPYDGKRRTVAVIFGGNNTVTITGDGIQGTLTNSLIDAYRAKSTNATYLAYEQINFTGVPKYQIRHHTWVWGNRTGWAVSEAARLLSKNRYLSEVATASSNNIVDIGYKGPAADVVRYYQSGGTLYAYIGKDGVYVNTGITNTGPVNLAGGKFDLNTSGTLDISGVFAALRVKDRSLTGSGDYIGLYRSAGVGAIYDYNIGANMLSYDTSGILSTYGAVNVGGSYITLAGTSSSTIRLKRNGTQLDLRLGDDSNYAGAIGAYYITHNGGGQKASIGVGGSGTFWATSDGGYNLATATALSSGSGTVSTRIYLFGVGTNGISASSASVPTGSLSLSNLIAGGRVGFGTNDSQAKAHWYNTNAQPVIRLTTLAQADFLQFQTHPAGAVNHSMNTNGTWSLSHTNLGAPANGSTISSWVPVTINGSNFWWPVYK